MEKEKIKAKLKELKTKQVMVDKAWTKAGNRELLSFFIEIIPQAVGAERVSIFIHDPEDERVWLQCGTDIKDEKISVPQNNSLVGRVIFNGETIFDNNMRARLGAHDEVAFQTGFIACDSLCVPVRGVTTDKVTGVIQAINKVGAGNFDEKDEALLLKLAFHIQMHIENIYLRQEMAKISIQMGKTIDSLEARLKKGS